MEEKQDNRCRRDIRIDKQSHWEMIDELMTLPAYEKSFNKVIVDALDYGLPLLIKDHFEVEEEVNGEHSELHFLRKLEGEDEEYEEKIVRLLQEIIMNETINKSMLSSLFRLRSLELKGSERQELFEKGKLSETPDCYERYELRALAEMQREKRK